MNILITGIAGFIGTNLAIELSKENAVFGSDVVDDCPNTELLKDLLRSKFDRRSCYGINYSSSLTMDVVIHLASHADPAVYQKYPVETLMHGARTPGYLQYIKSCWPNAYIIYASSSEIYGNPWTHDTYMKEDRFGGEVYPDGPRSMYTESKRFGEAACEIARKEGMKIATIRIFNTYGPHFHPDDKRLIPAWLTAINNQQTVEIHGTGQQRRSFMYIDDLVRAIKYLIYNQAKGVYNIGNPTQHKKIDEVKYLISRKFEYSNFRLVSPREQEINGRLPDIERMRGLGWEPYIDLEHGIERTWEWLTSKN